MATPYILGGLGLVFLVAAAVRLAKDGGKIAVATRTWLLIGVIFTAVAAWTW